MNITTKHTKSCDRCGRPCDSYIMIMDKRICGVCQWEQMSSKLSNKLDNSIPPSVPTDGLKDKRDSKIAFMAGWMARDKRTPESILFSPTGNGDFEEWYGIPDEAKNVPTDEEINQMAKTKYPINTDNSDTNSANITRAAHYAVGMKEMRDLLTKKI